MSKEIMNIAGIVGLVAAVGLVVWKAPKGSMLKFAEVMADAHDRAEAAKDGAVEIRSFIKEKIEEYRTTKNHVFLRNDVAKLTQKYYLASASTDPADYEECMMLIRRIDSFIFKFIQKNHVHSIR